MEVKLMAYTPNPDYTCGLAASVCTDYQGDPIKALRGALNSGHESVAEHAVFTFTISGVSRALLAQLTRHRIASFSVQSQRYVYQGDQFEYVTPPKIMALGENTALKYQIQMRTIAAWYKEWVALLGGDEAAKEDARFVLPNACCTTLEMTMNARELLHFFSLRCCNRAQWEIRAMANEMLQRCKEKAPVIFAHAGPGCVRGNCPEGAKSCKNQRKDLMANGI